MSEQAEVLSIDEVQTLIGESGYEVERETEDLLKIRDLDSGIVVRAVLEDNIVFFTVTCVTLPAADISPELKGRMLASDNGISTSGFQLYEREDGTVAITLNNFCKLQELGPDDRDDILSCIEFLSVDVYAAKELLGG